MNSNKKHSIIFSVSDGTGETAVNIVRAVKVQFADSEIQLECFNKISNREILEEILISAQEKKRYYCRYSCRPRTSSFSFFTVNATRN